MSFIILSVKLKAVAGADSTSLYFAAPEILLDMPYSMGCYELTTVGNTINFDTTMSDPSPASCLLTCQAKGSNYRFAGMHHALPKRKACYILYTNIMLILFYLVCILFYFLLNRYQKRGGMCLFTKCIQRP